LANCRLIQLNVVLLAQLFKDGVEKKKQTLKANNKRQQQDSKEDEVHKEEESSTNNHENQHPAPGLVIWGQHPWLSSIQACSTS
jgi:hypothetical protein